MIGMNAQDVAPMSKEKMPSKSSMKLAYKSKGKKYEAKESPSMEAKSHPPAFLQKAAKMAGKC